MVRRLSQEPQMGEKSKDTGKGSAPGVLLQCRHGGTRDLGLGGPCGMRGAGRWWPHKPCCLVTFSTFSRCAPESLALPCPLSK